MEPVVISFGSGKMERQDQPVHIWIQRWVQGWKTWLTKMRDIQVLAILFQIIPIEFSRFFAACDKEVGLGIVASGSKNSLRDKIEVGSWCQGRTDRRGNPMN